MGVQYFKAIQKSYIFLFTIVYYRKGSERQKSLRQKSKKERRKSKNLKRIRMSKVKLDFQCSDLS